jgi:hypothetical protein
MANKYKKNLKSDFSESSFPEINTEQKSLTGITEPCYLYK